MQILETLKKHINPKRTDAPAPPKTQPDWRNLPKDVLELIFFIHMGTRHRAKAALVCKRWRNLTKDNLTENSRQYHRGHLAGRRLILDTMLKLYRLPTDPGFQLCERANVFLEESADFTKLVIPRPPKSYYDKLSLAISKATHATFKIEDHLKTNNDLCVAIQDYLEIAFARDSPAHGSMLHLGTFLNINFNVDSQNPYEIQGIHDCLFPFLNKSIADRPSDRGFPVSIMSNCTLPVFFSLMQALIRSDKIKHIEFNLGVTGVQRMDQLVMFGHHIISQALSDAKHLQAITFSSGLHDKVVNWTADEGLSCIKEGLTQCPNLQKITFYSLNTFLDEQNIQPLVEAIIQRQKNPKAHRLKVVLFGSDSLTIPGCKGFMKGLKNYPAPLIIVVGPQNAPASALTLCPDILAAIHANRNLHLLLTNVPSSYKRHTLYSYDRLAGTWIQAPYKEALKRSCQTPPQAPSA